MNPFIEPAREADLGLALCLPSLASRLWHIAAVAIVFLWATAAVAAAAGYASPEQAVNALVAAVRGGQPDAIEGVLGPGSRKLVQSGDPVADQHGRDDFVAAFTQHHAIETQSADRAVLQIGANDWPFPIPLRREGDVWRFDVRAGADEILDRRIGRNELNAINTCLAVVDAERDYASEDPMSRGIAVYARRFVSHAGKKDGLFWPASPGEPQSPLGPLMAEAQAEGYRGRHAPYHGYYYKILVRQGPHASGGARDYVVKGEMIGGFALVAYPAKWGNSGVMTFMVNQEGIVYEKNLGRTTARIASRLTRFDPDKSWRVAPVSAGATR